MAEYKAIYKCRLCGQGYSDGARTSEEIARLCMEQINVGITGLVAPAPTLTATHHCGGPFAGSLGLADFQGWRAAPPLCAEDKTESGLLEE